MNPCSSSGFSASTAEGSCSREPERPHAGTLNGSGDTLPSDSPSACKTPSRSPPAGLLTLVMAASSPAKPISFQNIAWALSALGWHQSGRQPISAETASWVAADTLGVLENITLGPRRRSQRHQLAPVSVELATP